MDNQLRITVPDLPDIRLRLKEPGPWVAGSSAECDIPIRARGVSRRHIELHLDPGGGLAFRDLGSTNGTLLNALRCGGGGLSVGSVLQLGVATIKVEDAATEALGSVPNLTGLAFRSVLELRNGLPSDASEDGAGTLAAVASLVDGFIKTSPGPEHWEVLCREFAEVTGCTTAKCYTVHEEQLSIRASSSGFPEDRIPMGLAQACALMPQAASFELRDKGQAPLCLFSMAVRMEGWRAVFLGVFEGGRDPVVRHPEKLVALPLLFRLVLNWAGELSSHARAVEDLRLQVQRLQALRQDLLASHEPLLGKSRGFLRTLDEAERAAPSPVPVLLQGETGTGKELLARRIHDLSQRSGGPFVAINCAAIPEGLLESELFGARKGAFAGADRTRRGLIRSASGGTLFLDEIGDMPLALQAKVLRALDTKRVRPLGDTVEQDVDVRLLSASNRNLLEMAKAGRFREDLYYRLAVTVIAIPPLRDRGSDVESLANAFLEQANRELNKNVQGFEEEALAALKAHPWPGNVRELLAVVKNLVLSCRGTVITGAEVTSRLQGASRLNEVREKPWWGSPWADAKAAFEREYFSRKLSGHEGTLAALARDLGMARPNLHTKLRELGLRMEKGD